MWSKGNNSRKNWLLLKSDGQQFHHINVYEEEKCQINDEIENIGPWKIKLNFWNIDLELVIFLSEISCF